MPPNAAKAALEAPETEPQFVFCLSSVEKVPSLALFRTKHRPPQQRKAVLFMWCYVVSGGYTVKSHVSVWPANCSVMTGSPQIPFRNGLL